MFQPALPIGIKHVQSNKHVFVHDANGFYLFQCQDWQIAEYIVDTINNKVGEVERLEQIIVELEEKLEEKLVEPFIVEPLDEPSPFIPNQDNRPNPQSHLG